MKKKIFIFLIAVAAVAVITFFVGTGFTENTNVHIISYSLSEDESQLDFTVGIMSSIGYVRGYKDTGGGVRPHYLVFYNTFGGINSSFGAKNSFTLELGKDDAEIYFNRAEGGYELVLQKDESTGQWIRPGK